MDENNINITTDISRVNKTNLNRALRDGQFEISKLFELLELSCEGVARDITFAAEEKDDDLAKKIIEKAASKIWYAYLLKKEEG